MSKEYLVYRFLKARSDIDKNADILSSLIESDRGIDAVELELDKLNSQKQVLSYSDLSYCLMNINNHLILLYPYEERDKYMGIKDELQFGGKMQEYRGVSYAEASALKDFLDAAEVNYKARSDTDGMIQFLVSSDDEKIMDEAIKKLMKEIDTDVGRKYLMGKNACYANSITQISKALDYNEDVYIGTEGGTNGIHINSDGAVIMRTNEKSEFISKMDKNFEFIIQDIVINEFRGDETPVKAFFGDFAKDISFGMSQTDIKKNAMTRNEAMQQLGLEKFPTMEWLAKKKDKNELTGKNKEALYALIRMNLCRTTELAGYDEYKMSKNEKAEYKNMHNRNIDAFERGGERIGER